MSRQRAFTLALTLCLAVATTTAQNVCITTVPDVVSPGGTVVLKVSDFLGTGFEHRLNCLFTTIHVGVPNGTIAPFLVSLCSSTYVPIAPLGFATKSFTVPATTANGRYYMKVQYRLPLTTVLLTEWAPFTVHSSTSTTPLLTVANGPNVGQVMNMSLSSSSDPFMPYFAAASLTTNIGISVSPVFISLDPDILFALSFPVPDPTLFANFQNTLDMNGAASGIAVIVPNIPQIVGFPLHFQVGIIDMFGNPKVSNPVSSCIAP